jgi:hypothetical protein
MITGMTVYDARDVAVCSGLLVDRHTQQLHMWLHACCIMNTAGTSTYTTAYSSAAFQDALVIHCRIVLLRFNHSMHCCSHAQCALHPTPQRTNIGCKQCEAAAAVISNVVTKVLVCALFTALRALATTARLRLASTTAISLLFFAKLSAYFHWRLLCKSS